MFVQNLSVPQIEVILLRDSTKWEIFLQKDAMIIHHILTDKPDPRTKRVKDWIGNCLHMRTTSV